MSGTSEKRRSTESRYLEMVPPLMRVFAGRSYSNNIHERDMYINRGPSTSTVRHLSCTHLWNNADAKFVRHARLLHPFLLPATLPILLHPVLHLLWASSPLLSALEHVGATPVLFDVKFARRLPWLIFVAQEH